MQMCRRVRLWALFFAVVGAQSLAWGSSRPLLLPLPPSQPHPVEQPLAQPPSSQSPAAAPTASAQGPSRGEAGARGATVKIGLDAEFGIPDSTSAQAVRLGAQVAVEEINAAGGVLGRRLELIERDNRAVPARSLNNLRELAADPDVIAVMCARYSPVVVELLPEIHRLGMPLLDPWAAADGIIDNGYQPNYVFRLSLRDSWALQVMMRHAKSLGAMKVGVLIPNTEWGRSSLRAAETTASQDTRQTIVGVQNYNWGDSTLIQRYQALREAGAQAIILVANDKEAVILVKEMAQVPPEQRLPLVSHWGITGGRFFENAGAALRAVDLSVVQTYSFLRAKGPMRDRVLAGIQKITGESDPRRIASPVGVAHAYDLVHLSAKALKKAGRVDRAAFRKALEELGPHQGLVKPYTRPFTPQRHEALSPQEVFMARFAEDGAIEPIRKPARP
jgi:branched-chain amino acid transport system substrate-binding protein